MIHDGQLESDDWPPDPSVFDQRAAAWGEPVVTG